MPFAFVSPKITQSGTDTDATIISGLSAIAGVTTIAESGGRTRIIIPYLLDITSVFSPSPLIAFTFTAANSPANIVTITSTGRWNYKESRTLNGLTTWRRMPPIIFTRAVNNGYNNNNNNLIYTLGGTLDFAGVEIIGNGGQYWQGGTIILRDVVINAEGLAASNDNQITTQAGNPTLDIDGLEIRGASMFLKDAVITQLSRLQPKFVSRGFGNGFGLQKTLQNFDSQGAVFDVAIYQGGAIRCNNAVKGGGVTVGPWNAPSNVNNESYCTADLLLTGINELGAAVLFKAYHIDNNTNAPVGAGVTATNYTLRKTYNVLSSAGVATMNILLAASLNDGTMRRRSVSLTDDLYSFACFSYLSLPVVTTAINLAGAGVKTATSVQLKDPSISQLTKATVDAYATIDPLDRLYDRAKAFIFDTFAGETAGLFIGAGSTLDAGAKNIVIDATAAVAFAYNAGTNTITIKSSTLSAGTKFLTLATTGTVSAINGAGIANIEILGNVTQAAPAALTNVSITGTLSYNTAANASVTYTNSTLSTVANSGAGIVTVKRVNSTLTPGTNVVAYVPTVLTFALNGGRVRVLNHLGVEQFNQTADGTFELPANATGTWSYKVAKYGSKPIEATFAINGTTIAIAPAYIPDPVVFDTLANVLGYTTLGTTQKIYDYYSYALTTATGILLTKSVTLTASVLNLGAYTLGTGALGVTETVISINGSTVSGLDVVTTGNQNGVNPTYPQRITDSVATSTWVNTALATGRIRLLDHLGVEQANTTTDSITLLPKTATGTWTYKIVRYGSQPIFGSFGIDGIIKFVTPAYIPDTLVSDTLTNVQAYTALDTSQKIYDYYSFYLASAAGILVTKTILLSNTKLDLANYSITNTALSIIGNVIGINSPTVAGVNIVTTATIGTVTPTYPQTITDASSSSNWLDLTLNGGRIRILNHLGVEQFNQTSGGTILLPAASTGTWNYKVVKYGSLPIFGSFNIDGTIKIIVPSYIPDTAVVASLAVVSAYTVLDTSQKIYDYYALFLASAVGILQTKSVVLTPVILDLGSYNLTAGTIAASPTSIALGSADLSGVNVTTTGSVTGVTPTYPQQLASSAGTTNWLRITPTTGQVYLDSVNSTYSSTATTTFLPATFTSAITIFVTRRGYKKQAVIVPYTTTLLASQSFVLIPDSNVLDVVTDLSTANLTTSQLIYDAFSQYQASSAGITDTYVPSKSPGAVDFEAKGFSLLTATNFSTNPLQLKSTGLLSDAYYSDASFDQGAATISNAVLIRAANLDSEIVFTPDGITFYPNENARDTGTTPGVTVTGGVYRFLHGSTVAGVTMSGTVYITVLVGAVKFFTQLTLVPGANLMDLSVQGQITVLSQKIDQVPPKVWGAQLDGIISAKRLLVTTASALAGKAEGGGTDTITIRNLSDTANAIAMTVDVNGNRSSVTVAP